MAILDTKTVLDRLGEHGHNYAPDKQLYKAAIAGDHCIIYGLRGELVEVKASDVDQYIAKGMTADDPGFYDDAAAVRAELVALNEPSASTPHPPRKARVPRAKAEEVADPVPFEPVGSARRAFYGDALTDGATTSNTARE
jgi:hypothetical protein